MSCLSSHGLVARVVAGLVVIMFGVWLKPANSAISVFGGPTYSEVDGGFLTPDLSYGKSVNNAGTAVGSVEFYDATGYRGTRPIRWDSTGWVELDTPDDSLGAASKNGFANAINDAGTVVGRAAKYDAEGRYLGDRPVRWSSGETTAVELGVLGTDPDGYTFGDVFAINNSGTPVGYVNLYDQMGRFLGNSAVRWHAGSAAATPLDRLGTDTGGVAVAFATYINAHGDVTGYSDRFDDGGNYLGFRTVRWETTGTFAIELQHLGVNAEGRTTNVHPTGINDTGTVVGWSVKFDAAGNALGDRPVRWETGTTAITELGLLGIDPPSGRESAKTMGINSTGAVIGQVIQFDATGSLVGQRAVRWEHGDTVARELQSLGTDPSGFTYSAAGAINDAGFAVGESRVYDAELDEMISRAMLWRPDGMGIDLNSLIDPDSGWILSEARAISNTGWIAGKGEFDPDGPGELNAYTRLFLIQVDMATVPEPTNLAFFSIFIGTIAFSAFRKRSQRARLTSRSASTRG